MNILISSAEGVVLKSVAGEVVESLETFGVAGTVAGTVFLEVGVVIGELHIRYLYAINITGGIFYDFGRNRRNDQVHVHPSE